ncbi:MAG: hypothetical protein WC451_03085 [Patescibacteria group bacterium]|jgi:hypothetical protein
MEQEGQINRYICEKCHNVMITVTGCEGVTPFMIICDACHNLTAQSVMYNCPQDIQPQYVWFRPTSDNEIRQWILKDFEFHSEGKTPSKEELERMMMAMKHHVSIGGLMIKKIPRNPLDRLRDDLSKSAAFVALITDNYHKSIETAAHLGLALLMDKPIYLLIEDSFIPASKLFKICDGWEMFEKGNTEELKEAGEKLLKMVSDQLGGKPDEYGVSGL